MVEIRNDRFRGSCCEIATRRPQSSLAEPSGLSGFFEMLDLGSLAPENAMALKMSVRKIRNVSKKDSTTLAAAPRGANTRGGGPVPSESYPESVEARNMHRALLDHEISTRLSQPNPSLGRGANVQHSDVCAVVRHILWPFVSPRRGRPTVKRYAISERNAFSRRSISKRL